VSPERQVWSCLVPAEAPDGYEIQLDPSGPGYSGTLRSSVDGSVLRQVRIFARAAENQGRNQRTAMTMTDDQGRFEFRGLEPVAQYLTFEGGDAFVHEFDGIYAFPNEAPRTPPAQFEIALPQRSAGELLGVSLIEVRGKVRSASTDVMLLNGSIGSVLDGGSCAIQVWSQVILSADGSYEARLPSAPEFRAVFYLSGDEHPAELRWTASNPGQTEVHDFELP
jgi:hypothetical protein